MRHSQEGAGIDKTVGVPPYQLQFDWLGVEWRDCGPAWPSLEQALRVRDWLRMETSILYRISYNGGTW